MAGQAIHLFDVDDGLGRTQVSSFPLSKFLNSWVHEKRFFIGFFRAGSFSRVLQEAHTIKNYLLTAALVIVMAAGADSSLTLIRIP